MPAVNLYGVEYSLADEEAYIDIANDDYLGVLQDLLPYGPAWPRHPGAWLTRLLRGLAREFARVEVEAARLLEEADPRTAQELLGAWETFAGLPGCGELPTTVEERQAAVTAKLTQHTQPSIPTFTAIAEGLGYTGVVVAREARPFTVGSTVGDSLRGGPWAHTWSITTDQSTQNDTLLRCLVGQLAPQHGAVIFNLGAPAIS